MTDIEKQEIIDEVIESIRTNARTIESLTPQLDISDDALIELNGGRMISFGLIKAILSDAFSVTDIKELVEKGVERLRTARKIWGQDFDGSKDVDGNMTVNGTATINGPVNATSVTAGNFTFRYVAGDDAKGSIKNYNGSDLMTFDFKTGNIGIGGDPDEKLHVYGGNIKAEGDVIGNNIQTLGEDVGNLKKKVNVIDALEQSEVLPFVAVIEGSEDINDLHAGKEGFYYSTDKGYFYYCNAKKQVSVADEPYNVSAGLGQVGGSAPGSKVANKARLYQSAGKLYYFEGGELVESNSIADSPDIVYSAETRQLSITEAAKRALFNDLWNEAWGTNGGYKPNEAPDKSKPYKAYDLWLTYEEALAVYDLGYITNQNLNSRYVTANVRTTLPSRIKFGIANGQYIWQGSSVEVIDASLLVPGAQCFQSCAKLRRITNIYSINANAAIDTVYKGCVALESIEKFNTVYRQNFSLADSPLLNLATFQRIVDKTAASGNQFTITVAPKIFDALLGDGGEWPVNGGTKEEWAKVLTDAQAKNITFATA